MQHLFEKGLAIQPSPVQPSVINYQSMSYFGMCIDKHTLDVRL